MKEAFKFDEYKPCLDWYITEHHIINWGDYNYFKLDRRFGPSWWLYGMKLIENPYHWEEKNWRNLRGRFKKIYLMGENRPRKHNYKHSYYLRRF